jgi:chromosome segregation ATPase
MRKTTSPLVAARITCAVSVVISALAMGASAQSKPDDLTITTSSGSFQLASLSSLINDTALLSAERVAELALPAAQKDVAAAKKELDKIDEDIAKNYTAMEKEKEALAKARLAFQPTIDAYTKDLDTLHADDAQFGKDKAPVQAQLDAYNAVPEKDRTEAQYKSLAALKAPFDARWNAILARKAALDARYDAMSKIWTEQEQPLVKLQTIDLELLAQRKAKTAMLGDAYRQLQACYRYSTQIKAQLERLNRTPPPTLTPMLETAYEILKGMSNLGFDGVK